MALKNLYRSPGNAFWGKWFLLASVAGLTSGLAAILFQYSLCKIELVCHTVLAFFNNCSLAPKELVSNQIWLIVPLIAMAGLLSGLMVHFFSPEAKGSGIDETINAFHNRRGEIAWPLPIVKLVASTLTLGAGGSAGKEGPIAQISAGLASNIGRLLRLSTHDRRMLLAIGMGAGVGAIFRAPLAGAIFASEILYQEADLESEVIIPGALASVIAYSVFQLSLPRSQWFTPLFGELDDFKVGHIAELVPFTLLAVAVVIIGIGYVSIVKFTTAQFHKTPIPLFLRPCIGMMLTGMFAVSISMIIGDSICLATMGTGFEFLKQILANPAAIPVSLLLVIGFGKMITTSLTVGSGGAGGVFGPSIVIGGCIGATTGNLLQRLVPEWGAQPSAYAIVGMAGFFAGVANAPFSTILMVAEITGSYKLLLPTLWVSSISYILCRNWSLYSKQVASRLQSPAHLGDFTVDLLAGLCVRDAFRETGNEGIVFHEQSSLDEIVHSLAKSPQRYFHVYDASEKLVGIFSAEDVRQYLYDDTLWRMVNAQDVMTVPVVTLQTDDDLNRALGLFTKLNLEELPVVSSDNPDDVIGVLRRKETIALYNQRRLELHKLKEAENG